MFIRPGTQMHSGSSFHLLCRIAVWISSNGKRFLKSCRSNHNQLCDSGRGLYHDEERSDFCKQPKWQPLTPEHLTKKYPTLVHRHCRIIITDIKDATDLTDVSSLLRSVTQRTSHDSLLSEYKRGYARLDWCLYFTWIMFVYFLNLHSIYFGWICFFLFIDIYFLIKFMFKRYISRRSYVSLS